MASCGMESASQRLAAIAKSQYGVFTRSQARTVNVMDRTIDGRVANGVYERIHPHVLCFAGSPATWHRSVMASVLSAGSVSAASHTTAAYLWGLTSLRPDQPEVTSRRHLRVRTDDFVVHESKDLLEADIVAVAEIPVTTAVRTVVDLGASAPMGVVARCLDAGLRTNLFTLSEIQDFVKRVARPGRTGVGTIRPLIEERHAWQSVTESTLEDLFRSIVVRSALLMPEPQFELHNGRFIGRFDFAYPQQRALIELDSEKWHMDPGSFQRDRDKQNQAHQAGWTVYRFTWKQLTTAADQVIDTLASITAAYGAHGRQT